MNTTPVGDFVLHHTAVLVPDIPKAIQEYCDRFGYRIASAMLHEPTQTAYVQFLSLRGGGGWDVPYLELITPDREDSALRNALKKGGGLNHFCYTVDNIEKCCDALKTKKMLLLKEPALSEVFTGRRTAWMIGYDAIPVELVEFGVDDWEKHNIISGGEDG